MKLVDFRMVDGKEYPNYVRANDTSCSSCYVKRNYSCIWTQKQPCIRVLELVHQTIWQQVRARNKIRHGYIEIFGLSTLCVQIFITKDSKLRTSCHLVVFTIRCLHRIFYRLIRMTELWFVIKTQLKTWYVVTVSNTKFVKPWYWTKMSGGILRSVLVFLLENHFVRFVVTLLMSCAYDTYSYGKDSLRNYIKL